MRRGLIVLHDTLEAVHRRQILLAVQVIPADLHLLAGQMVAGEIELQLRVARVFGVWKAAHDVIQRVEGSLGHLLVPADVGDLHVIADRFQVIRVGHIPMTRMQLDEPLGGEHGVVVFAALVIRVNLHQLAFRRPRRIGMLALDLVESFRRVGVALVDKRVQRLVIKLVYRLLDIGLVLVAAAGGDRKQQRGGAEPQRP